MTVVGRKRPVVYEKYRPSPYPAGRNRHQLAKAHCGVGIKIARLYNVLLALSLLSLPFLCLCSTSPNKNEYYHKAVIGYFSWGWFADPN